MSSPPFSKIPASATITPTPFRAHIDDDKLSDFKALLRLSPVGPATFENSGPHAQDRTFGVSRDWLIQAKEQWLSDRFDWRRTEDRLNAFPQFTARIGGFNDDSGAAGAAELDIHFLALFSEREDAVPLALYHGWPGSVLEFLPILTLLTDKYTPATLPYNVVVPSLPGYAFSSSPPVTHDFSVADAARALDKLMTSLGLGGYVAQGGDIGAWVARYQGAECEACRGVQINFSPGPVPANAHELGMSEVEKKALSRGLWFKDVGAGYAIMQGTRTATIGSVLSASPLGLLSWIGEKFLDWSDEDPDLDFILSNVTLYWLTETFARCIWFYRGMSGGDHKTPRIASCNLELQSLADLTKPTGYSFFPMELAPVPVSWVAAHANVVSSTVHTSGGHFAALEKPKELLEDIEKFIKAAFGASSK